MPPACYGPGPIDNWPNNAIVRHHPVRISKGLGQEHKKSGDLNQTSVLD